MDGAELNQSRTQLGLSRERMAAAVGVSIATITRWEKNLTRPDEIHAKKLKALILASEHNGKLTRFRPIQYLGSKLRLLDQILYEVGAVAPRATRVCDLFSGSSVVARAMADKYDVASVDIQEFAALLARALLKGQPVTPDEINEIVSSARSGTVFKVGMEVFGDLIAYEAQCIKEAGQGNAHTLANLIDHASIAAYQLNRGAEGATSELANLIKAAAGRLARLKPVERRLLVIPAFYGGSYFSYDQACMLAALDSAIVRASVAPAKKFVARAALLHVSSEIVGTVGKQFAQPMRLLRRDGSPKQLLVQRILADRVCDVSTQFIQGAKVVSSAVSTKQSRHVVRRADYAAFLADDSTEFDCVYADPPYTIDHYSRFYHVLETIARRDIPRLATMTKGGTVVAMRGLYRTDRAQSAFCIPSQVEAAFDTLFSGVAARRVPLVLSYSPYSDDDGNRPRLLSLFELKKIAQTHFTSVKIHNATPHTHRRLNAAANNVKPLEKSEAFIICNTHG